MDKAIIALMLLSWAAGFYCQHRTWTPEVRMAWDERRQAGFTFPRSCPPSDLLGPDELV